MYIGNSIILKILSGPMPLNTNFNNPEIHNTKPSSNQNEEEKRKI